MLFSAPLPAFCGQAAPPGMTAYDHPVFHNGRRVLWRGAWRVKAPQKSEAPAPAASAPTKGSPGVAAKPPPPGPGEYSILADADDSCATRLAGEFVAALQADGAKGRVIAGRTSPAALAKAVKSDAADLAIAPMDALIGDDNATADWRDRAPYIARLGAETIEIIAPRAVAEVRQLAGRDVGFGIADSAGAATAATLFSRLGVAPKPSFAPLAPALADLSAGKLAAVVAVGAKSSKTLADFGKDGRFHVIAIPWTPALRALYAPARLTAKDRPNLIGADEKIDTLGAPMALIALDAAPSSARADQVAALTKSFFERFDRLLGPDNDAIWRDVNLAAGAPWPRLRAAQDWIDRKAAAPNASFDAFRAIAKTAASGDGGPGAADSDRLFDSLMQWRGAGQ
ncbi:MAG: TAXI family TRAP transporter solute-binding subunit [Roseiarcus sp.]|jgi:TRAP-type uncharacterized transport system substrate-binding protein